MGTDDRTVETHGGSEVVVPDNLKPILDQIMKSTSGLNTDMSNNPIVRKMYETAMGNNLNAVNPYEQAQLNHNIDNSNNAIMRQFDAAGRGNSFSNLQAVTGNTDNLTSGFMANNLNRNRQAMMAAQAGYLGQANQGIQNKLAANGLLANLIRGLSSTKTTGQQVIPGRTWAEDAGGLLGSIGGLFKHWF